MNLFHIQSASNTTLKVTLGEYIRNNSKFSLCCKLVITILLLCFFSHLLWSAYRVPEHFTEIHIGTSSLMDTGAVHISVVRNYSWDKPNIGEIVLYGALWNEKNNNGTFHSSLSKEDKVRSYATSLLDTTDIDPNSYFNLAYLTIKTKNRHHFGRHYAVYLKKSVFFKDDTLQMHSNYYWQYGNYKMGNINNKYCNGQIWTFPIHRLFEFRKNQVDKSWGITESYIIVSDSDMVIPVSRSLTADDWKRPNLLLNFEDLRKAEVVFKTTVATTQYIASLTIDYVGSTDFIGIKPEPDVVGDSYIRYTNRDKLWSIAHDGLRFHARFNELENLHEIRMFALTALVTILITLLLSILYKLALQYFKKKKFKHPKWVIIGMMLLGVITIFGIWAFMGYYDSDKYEPLKFETLDNGKDWEPL